jgi:hypothetical protein
MVSKKSNPSVKKKLAEKTMMEQSGSVEGPVMKWMAATVLVRVKLTNTNIIQNDEVSYNNKRKIEQFKAK